MKEPIREVWIDDEVVQRRGNGNDDNASRRWGGSLELVGCAERGVGIVILSSQLLEAPPIAPLVFKIKRGNGG